MDIAGFILTSALLTLMPGPDILFVLSQGLTRGRSPAAAVSAGLASGLLVHTTAAALGLSLIVSRWPVFLETIRYAGVAYLAYMGFKAFFSHKRPPHSGPTEAAEKRGSDRADKRTLWQMYRVGVTMNLLNPKVILFFLALFPQFLNPAAQSPKADIFLLGGLFSLVSLAIFSAVAVVSGFLGGKISVGQLPPKTLGRINALVYWGIAAVFLLV